jgi:hypothetical protein
MREQDVIAIPLGGCRLFVAFRSAKGFPGMNTTFRGAKGDYVLELKRGRKRISENKFRFKATSRLAGRIRSRAGRSGCDFTEMRDLFESDFR